MRLNFVCSSGGVSLSALPYGKSKYVKMSVLAENEGFTLGKFDRIKVAVEGRSVFKLSHMVIQSMSNM